MLAKGEECTRRSLRTFVAISRTPGGRGVRSLCPDLLDLRLA